MKTKTRKQMLRRKNRVKMPKPVSAKKDRGFSLRQINEADARLAVVKTLRKRLKQLMVDAGVDCIQREWLAGRAVFLVAHLESLEVDALEGKDIDWRSYIQSVKALSDVLNKLGLDKDVTRGVKRLETYIVESKSSK